MRGIDKSGQDPQGKKDAGKHDAALDELRRIKVDLSRAGSVEEIKYLILKFNNVAGGVPGELIPLDLADDAIEAVYTRQIAQITDPRQPISEQDLQNGEKAVERALKGLIFINDKVNKFLNRDDIKSSIQINKEAAESQEPLTVQQVDAVLEDDAKTKVELQEHTDALLATPLEGIIRKGREAESKSKTPKEKEECRKATNQHVAEYLQNFNEVKKLHQNKAKAYEKPEVQERVGKAVAEARAKELNDTTNRFEERQASVREYLRNIGGFEDVIMNPEVAHNQDVSGRMPDVTKISANMTMQPEIRTVGGVAPAPPTTPSKGLDTPSEGISR